MAFLVAASLIAWASHGSAQDTTSARQKPTDNGAAKTREAIEQLRRALVEWRAELGPGGKIDPDTAEELQSSLRALGRELEPILSARRAPTPAPAPVASEMQDRWVKDLRALGADADGRRAAAVAALREALGGQDAAMQLAALRALSQTGDVKFDRTPFRSLILPLIDAARGEIQVAALYALYNTSRQPGDLGLVHAAYARNPAALGPSVSHLLFLFGDGTIDGESARIVLEVLAAHDRSTRREALRGLWGAKVTPALAARLIELADDGETHGDAIYFGLSTLSEKNEAVIDKLIATLSDPDWTNNGHRALWGLGFGVPEALQPKVAAALVELHNTRVEPRVRSTCAELVRRYGGEEMAAKLEK
jgi:hypothetical protein